MIAKILMAASAFIFLTLGLLHLVYTFSGSGLDPRDVEVKVSMGETSPVISRETTMWRAWVGFNASHSAGLMLFGLIYAYLAIFQSELLFRSPFLLIVGLTMIISFVALTKLYFFSVPFWSVCVSLVCYIAGIAVSRMSE